MAVMHDPQSDPVASIRKLGIGIFKDHRHVGIVYKPGREPPRILHLAFHHDLRDEACSSRYFWGDSGLDETSQDIVVAWIVARRIDPDSIPYGFDSTGAVFEDDGTFIPPPLGKGFTCATFVTGVFRVLGFRLIDESTWPPRAEDAVWQAEIIGVLRETCRDELHVEALQADIGAPRIRPAEAAAGVVSSEIPLAFEQAEQLANQIVSELAGD